VLPWLIYGGAELLAQMPASRAWDGLVVLIVTIVAATSPIPKIAPIRQQTAIDLIGSAEWIQAHTDPGTKLMVHDAGLWTSPNQTYQIYRIKNRSAPAKGC
jgi:hypothetical protein